MTLAALAAASASAQTANPPLAGCSTYGAEDFELGVRVDDRSASYYFTLFDVASGVQVYPNPASGPFLYLPAPAGTGLGDCSLKIHFDNVGVPNTYRLHLSPDNLYRIDFWRSDSQTDVERFASYEFSHPVYAAAGSNFYSAAPADGGFPDALFIITYDGDVRTYYSHMNQFSPRTDLDPNDAYDRSFVEDFFPDGQWIMPYDFPALCDALIGCDGSDPADAEDYSEIFFITPSRTDASGFPREYATTAGATWRVPAGQTYTWANSGTGPRVSALRFGAGGRMTMKGNLNATGMLFTASNVSLGWGGLRWAPGSGGGLFGGPGGDTVVERVAGECLNAFCLSMGAGAAIHVEGTALFPSAPVFDGVTVRFPTVGTYVHGLRVTGAMASPLATDLLVRDMTGSGVYALGGSTPELRGLNVELQNNTESAVLSTGTNTNVFLSSVLVGGVPRGPQITSGKGAAVSATTSGHVTFSSPSGGLGFANLEDNDGRGFYASGAAVVYAGTFASRSRNRIVDNALGNPTGNGFATGSSTTVAARCNWWGSATPAAFRIGASGGALFDAGTFLLGDPYANANVACTDGSGGEDGLTAGGTTAARSGALASARGAGNGAGTASSFGEGDTPADRLSAAYDLPPAEALAVLGALVAGVPGAPEAAAALSFAGVLATGDATPPAVAAGAVALLTEQAASGALSQAAHGALVGVRLGGGDYAGALASAAALVALGGAAERTGYAAEVFVRSVAGETVEALSALAALESAWEGSDEALAAREHLTALGVEVPGGGRVAAPETASPDETETTAEAAITGEAAAPSLAVRPNPSAAGAPGTVTLTLAEATDVRVAVYDLLGREVAVVLSGALAAGEHTASPGALSPGVYVVRAQAAGRVLATTRLTVVR